MTNPEIIVPVVYGILGTKSIKKFQFAPHYLFRPQYIMVWGKGFIDSFTIGGLQQFLQMPQSAESFEVTLSYAHFLNYLENPNEFIKSIDTDNITLIGAEIRNDAARILDGQVRMHDCPTMSVGLSAELLVSDEIMGVVVGGISPKKLEVKQSAEEFGEVEDLGEYEEIFKHLNIRDLPLV